VQPLQLPPRLSRPGCKGSGLTFDLKMRLWIALLVSFVVEAAEKRRVVVRRVHGYQRFFDCQVVARRI
jgi:hypothetical protein